MRTTGWSIGWILLATLAAGCSGDRDRPEALTIALPAPVPAPVPGPADAAQAETAEPVTPPAADAAVRASDVASVPREVGPLPSLSPLVQRVRPAVVNIVAETVDGGPMVDRYGRRIYRPRTVRESLGSGFVVDANGTILSNAHVVRGADRVIVQLDDGREIPARVVGAESQIDLAVLDIDVEDLPWLELGDSDTVEVGDYVVAVGNPLGLSNSVTAGIVSAIGREITSEVPGYADFIQTDASINQGNSGGPLVDLHGRAIGINTAINPEGQGIGFAVPINMVRMVLPQILEHGSVTRAWMGLWWRPLDGKNARRLGIDVPTAPGRQRIWVADVVPGSPADAAGIRPNDVVLRFGDHDVDRPALFTWIASTSPVGRPVEVVLWREGRTLTVQATPVEMPESASAVSDTIRREP